MPDEQSPACSISYSTNGTSWTSSYSSASFNCSSGGAYFANSNFLVTGSGVLTSADGKSWSTASIDTSSGFSYSGVVYGKGVYVVAGFNSVSYAGAIFDSTDGSAWTNVYSPGSLGGFGSGIGVIFH